MWPYEPYPFTRRHEAEAAAIHKARKSPTEQDLRNSIYVARGNARFLVKVIRGSQGAVYAECRREALKALHGCRVDCRVAAWTLRLKREDQLARLT